MQVSGRLDDGALLVVAKVRNFRYQRHAASRRWGERFAIAAAAARDDIY